MPIFFNTSSLPSKVTYLHGIAPIEVVLHHRARHMRLQAGGAHSEVQGLSKGNSGTKHSRKVEKKIGGTVEMSTEGYGENHEGDKSE